MKCRFRFERSNLYFLDYSLFQHLLASVVWTSCLHYLTLSNTTILCDVVHLTLSHFPKPPAPFLLFSQGPGLLPIVPLRTVRTKTGSDFHYLATTLDLRINIAICFSKRFTFCTNLTRQYFLLPVVYFTSCQDFNLCSAEWRNDGMAGEWWSGRDLEGRGRGLRTVLALNL